MINPLEKRYSEIDLLALLLPPSLYAKVIEMVHPHVPKVADIVGVLKKASLVERKEVKKRAAAVGACTRVVEEALANSKQKGRS